VTSRTVFSMFSVCSLKLHVKTWKSRPPSSIDYIIDLHCSKTGARKRVLAKVKAKASELLAEGLAEKALEKYSELIKTGQGWSGGQGLQHMQKDQKTFVLWESHGVTASCANFCKLSSYAAGTLEAPRMGHDIILAGLAHVMTVPA